MNRALPAIVLSTAATIPAVAGWNPAQPSQLLKDVLAASTKAHKYKGPAEDMQWGPVQVTITIKGKKITKVGATAPTERARSQFINEQAVPLLKQETLKAQSANIDIVSGATLTSEAYIQSLQAAMDKAHFKPAHS